MNNQTTKPLDVKAHMRSCVQKVATGPEYSKDLSFDEAYHAMQAILSGEADEVQIAIFFIALRMKRETDEENRGILQALIDDANISQAKAEQVVDISDPYDGYARGVPVSTFVPAVLAALGYHVVLHGMEQVGPKFGATHHQILRAAGKDVLLTPEAATQQLDECGWTYIDQAQFAPRLNALLPLRQRMIKRQVLTTVEVLLGPIRGQSNTHYISGYVHKAYPPIYASLARQTGFDSALIIRGMEGGIIPSLQQEGRTYQYHQQGDETLIHTSPADVGINADSRAVPLPESVEKVIAEDKVMSDKSSQSIAEVSAQMGLEALEGKLGIFRDSLVYSSSICLSHLSQSADFDQIAEQVRAVIDSGEALTYFNSVK